MKRPIDRAVKLTALASSFTLMLLTGSDRVFAQNAIVPQDVITVGVLSGSDTPLEDALFSTLGTIVNHDKDCSDYVLKLLPGLDRTLTITLLQGRPEIRYAEAVQPGSSTSASVPSDPYYTYPYTSGYSAQYGPKRVQADLAWNIWRPASKS